MPIDQCLHQFRDTVNLQFLFPIKKGGRRTRNAPLHQHLLLRLEPPFLLAHALRRRPVEHDVVQEPPDLGHEQREVAHARRLHEVGLKPAIAVRGQLGWVDVDLERDSALPGEPPEERGRGGSGEGGCSVRDRLFAFWFVM